MVHHERHLRDRSGIIGIRLRAHPAQKCMFETADHWTVAPETQAIPDQRPHHRDYRHQHEALHHESERVLSAHQSAIKKRKARPGHHQYQRRAY